MILAHFDVDGLLDEHVRCTLASLAGPDTEIILVSTRLNQPCPHADQLVSKVIVRDNQGYDFGSWQIGLGALRNPMEFDEIVCLNDSFYLARERALVDGLARLATQTFGVAGMTVSREHCFHIQSYFMVFRRPAVQSIWFRAFWGAVSSTSDRAGAIQERELRMAIQARQAGLRTTSLLHLPLLPSSTFVKTGWSMRPPTQGVVAEFQTMVALLKQGRSVNPTLYDWMSVARRCGIVKVELLRDNPRDADLSSLDAAMEPACLTRARNHLARLRKAARQPVEKT